MSRETDSSPYPGEGGRGSGASYPSGTPPYGTGQQPKPQQQDRGPANQPPGPSEPAPDDPKTETTLTTRVRINIPGSRPIPPVVVRTPVNDDGEGGPAGPAPGEGSPSPVHGVVDPDNQGPPPVLPPGWEMPKATGQGRAASGAPGAPAGSAPTGTGGQARPTSDWFAPRKTGQQPVGPGAADRDTSGQRRLPQQPPVPGAPDRDTSGQRRLPQQPPVPGAADRDSSGQQRLPQQPPEPQQSMPYVSHQPRPGAGGGFPGGQGPDPAAGAAPGGPPPGPHQQPNPAFGGQTAGGGYPGPGPGGFPGQPPGPSADRSAPAGYPGQAPGPAGPRHAPGPPAGGPAPGGFAGERSAYEQPAPAPPAGPGPGPLGSGGPGQPAPGGGGYPNYPPPASGGAGTGMPAGPTTGPVTGPMTPPPPRRGEGAGAPQSPAGPGTGGYGPVGGQPLSSSDTLVSGIAAVPAQDPRVPSAPAADSASRADDGGEYRFPGSDDDAPQRGRSKLILAGAGLLGVVGIAYGAGLLLDHADVPRGTTVLGVDIGGKSTDDAVKALDSEVGVRATVPLPARIGSRNVQVDPRVAGLSIDTAATVRDVAHRDYNPISVIGSLFGGQRTAEAAVNIDEDKLRVALEDLAAKVDSDRSDGMVKFVGGKPVGVPGTAGPGLDVDGAVSTVRAAYMERSETGQNKRVALQQTQQEPKVDRAEIARAIKEVGKPAMSGLVFVKAGGLQPLPFSPKTLGKFLTMVPGGDGKLQLHFDLQALETTYGGYFDTVKVPRSGGSATPVQAEDVARAMLPALRQTDPAKRVGEIPIAQ